jgi:twitching motility two-component system response regulator PilG
MQGLPLITSVTHKTIDSTPPNRQAARNRLPMALAPFSQDTERVLSPLLVIVDDSETVRKILEVCLHRAGYEDVQSFPDGTEMLRWLMMPEARIPALVLVDLNLPTIDGYTLIRHLKAKPAFAQIVFVILTGRSGMLDRLKGRLCGAHAYLTKPFRTDDILAIVHSYLGPNHMQHLTKKQKAMAHR